MKRAILVGALASTLLIVLSIGQAGAAQPLDRIVAVADQGVVLESELTNAVERIQRQMGQRASRVPEDILRSQVLDRLILRSLQLQRATRHGLSVSSEALTEAMQRLAAQNNMSLPEFKNAMRAQNISPTQFRQRMYENMLIGKLRQQEVIGRIQISDEEVTRYLQSEQLRVQENREYHILHILIAVNDEAGPKAIETAREQAEQLRKVAVSEGQDFHDLALAHSDGQRALEGGDLGWLPGGYLPTLFADIVPQLADGEVSKVFRGPGGFHLIKLAGVRDKSTQQTAQLPQTVHEVKARQILVKLTEIRDNDAAKARITTLRKRLLAGDDFAQLARSASDDKHTANQGGDLGWVRPTQMPEEFATRLQNLEIDQISEPFRTDQGWVIVQVLDRRVRDVTKQRERQRARQAIGRRKASAKGEAWLRQIRAEAYVDIRMEGYRGQNG